VAAPPLAVGTPCVWLLMITESFPRTQIEFDKRFSTDEACHEYLSGVRWPNGFVCPHCGHKGGWRRNGREQWVCSAKSCGKETSLRVGTVLHKSAKPLKTWIWAMFLMTTNKQGISALRPRQLMGFGCYRTALRWLRELRRAMGYVVENQVLGPIVEADEIVCRPSAKKRKTGTHRGTSCWRGGVPGKRMRQSAVKAAPRAG